MVWAVTLVSVPPKQTPYSPQPSELIVFSSKKHPPSSPSQTLHNSGRQYSRSPPAEMAPSQMPHPEASMFPDSVNPSFAHSEFKAAGHDFFSPTFNVHFTAPLPGPSPAHVEYHPAESKEVDSKRHISLPSQNHANSRIPKNPGLRGVKRLLGLLSPNRPQSRPSEESTSSCLSGDITSKTTPKQSPYDADTPPLTPNLSSCASSPFSSQEDITVSSAEDLDPRISSSRYLTTPEVYVRSMLKSGKGLACWRPRPRNPKPSQRGTVPGDVGTFSAEGGFKKVFNLWDDEQSLQRNASASGSIPFRLPSRNITVDPQEIPQGRTIAEGASSKTTYYESDTRNIASFEFCCRSDSGAILAATSSAELEELEDYAELREWIVQHAQLIYMHTSKIRRIAGHEALYIITGCIKSDSWALASFKERANPYDPMRLENMSCDGNEQCHYDWTQTWSSSEARFGSSERVGLKDQTLFLRGFKLDFSPTFRMRMGGPYPPKTGSSGNGGSFHNPSSSASDGEEPGGNRGARRGGGSGGRSGSAGSGPPSSGSDSDTNAPQGNQHREGAEQVQTFEDRLNVRSFPSFPQDTCHPSDAINHYLLNTTGANFALCHDDEWRFAAEDLDNPIDFIRSNISKLEVDIQHGVALLPERDVCLTYLGMPLQHSPLPSSTNVQGTSSSPCPDLPCPSNHVHSPISSQSSSAHIHRHPTVSCSQLSRETQTSTGSTHCGRTFCEEGIMHYSTTTRKEPLSTAPYPQDGKQGDGIHEAPLPPQPPSHPPCQTQGHHGNTKVQQPLPTSPPRPALEREREKMLALLACEWPQEGPSTGHFNLEGLVEFEHSVHFQWSLPPPDAPYTHAKDSDEILRDELTVGTPKGVAKVVDEQAHFPSNFKRRLGEECTVWGLLNLDVGKISEREIGGLPSAAHVHSSRAHTSATLGLKSFTQPGTVLDREASSSTSRMSDDGRAQPPRIQPFTLLHGIAQGMQYLCSNGIPHRDIQVANIPVDSKSMLAVLSDFGLLDLEMSSSKSNATKFFPEPPSLCTNQTASPILFTTIPVTEASASRDELASTDSIASRFPSVREELNSTRGTILSPANGEYLRDHGTQGAGAMHRQIPRRLGIMQMNGTTDLRSQPPGTDHCASLEASRSGHPVPDAWEGESESSLGQPTWMAPEIISPGMSHYAPHDHWAFGGLLLMLLNPGNDAPRHDEQGSPGRNINREGTVPHWSQGRGHHQPFFAGPLHIQQRLGSSCIGVEAGYTLCPPKREGRSEVKAAGDGRKSDGKEEFGGPRESCGGLVVPPSSSGVAVSSDLSTSVCPNLQCTDDEGGPVQRGEGYGLYHGGSRDESTE